jgi:hypothetical protein
MYIILKQWNPYLKGLQFFILYCIMWHFLQSRKGNILEFKKGYTVLVRMRCLKLHIYCFDTMESIFEETLNNIIMKIKMINKLICEFKQTDLCNQINRISCTCS